MVDHKLMKRIFNLDVDDFGEKLRIGHVVKLSEL